jgi:hypothetical protein
MNAKRLRLEEDRLGRRPEPDLSEPSGEPSVKIMPPQRRRGAPRRLVMEPEFAEMAADQGRNLQDRRARVV